jgi:hypothetical protein
MFKVHNGDWGLGIGDWAQSPIPNPQSPFLIDVYLIKDHLIICQDQLLILKLSN